VLTEWRRTAGEQFNKSEAFLESRPHTPLVRAHQRFTTTTPPLSPPPLMCPACDGPLIYVLSQIGGVKRAVCRTMGHLLLSLRRVVSISAAYERMRVLRPDEQESVKTLKKAI
jgi:hypothetical protein